MNQIIRLFIWGIATSLFAIQLFPSSLTAAPKANFHAIKAATSWLARTPQPFATKNRATVDRVETYRGETGEALFFIVYLHPQGFIIVSADDLIEPIIGYFPTASTFSPLPDNPLWSMLSRDMPGRLENVRIDSQNLMAGKISRSTLPSRQQKARDKWDKLLADAPTTELKTTGLPDSSVEDIRVYPLVASKWSQDFEGGTNCYNYYTPNNYVCGCVATAMAQLMRFHQYPQAGVGTTQFSITVDGIAQNARLRGGDGNGGVYDWANMVLDPDSSTTIIQREAIGALHYDAGVSVNMSYRGDGSGASLQTSVSSLKNTFGYTNIVYGANYQSDDWLTLTESQIQNMINTNLDAGLPVILGIFGDSGGHAILTDGYGTSGSTPYHHLNMGWGGYDDGWYNMPSIQTTHYHFTVVDEVIYNMYPQGNGEVISGRILDDSGNPVEDVLITAVGGGKISTTNTDSRGVFAFVKVPSNTLFTITADKAGYTVSPSELSISTGASENAYNWPSYWMQSGNRWGLDFTVAADVQGDIDRDGSVTLSDAILALQVVTGLKPTTPVSINNNNDVDTDLKIGLAEAIYALEQSAEN